MKTPEEIKKSLKYCRTKIMCSTCPSKRSIDEIKRDGRLCSDMLIKDTMEYIGQLESTYGQVSKALCGKDSATLEEILEAVDQLKRERDALLHDLREAEKTACDCSHCRHYARLENENLCEESDFMCLVCEKECRCKTCTEDLNHYEWRGVCAENDGGETHES